MPKNSNLKRFMDLVFGNDDDLIDDDVTSQLNPDKHDVLSDKPEDDDSLNDNETTEEILQKTIDFQNLLIKSIEAQNDMLKEEAYCLSRELKHEKMTSNSLRDELKQAHEEHCAQEDDVLYETEDEEAPEEEETNAAIMDIAKFLKNYPPARIKHELDRYIIKQDELKRQCSLVFYQHIARLAHPDIPRYTLLIAGGSGTGKTEVWRILKKLYGDLVHVQFINCSTMTQEGYSGGNKLATNLLRLQPNTILVFDEFDKLCAPHFSTHTNFSPQMQAEFLKLIEGEYDISAMIDERKAFLPGLPPDDVLDSVSFVFVGAFTEIFDKKRTSRTIGFNSKSKDAASELEVTEEELIQFGMIPELVGRITNVCCTESLDLQDYVTIAKGTSLFLDPLRDFMKQHKLVCHVDDSEINALAEQSMKNKTGVRWIIGKLFYNYLNSVYEKGYYDEFELKNVVSELEQNAPDEQEEPEIEFDDDFTVI